MTLARIRPLIACQRRGKLLEDLADIFRKVADFGGRDERKLRHERQMRGPYVLTAAFASASARRGQARAFASASASPGPPSPSASARARTASPPVSAGGPYLGRS